MPTTDTFDNAFADMKEDFIAVAGRTSGEAQDRILEAALTLGGKGESLVRLAEAYNRLVDELEEDALTSPDAVQTLDDLSAAMSRRVAMMSMGM